jgi:cell division protein FtsW
VGKKIKLDLALLVIVLLLVVIGTSMIYSASNFKAKERYDDSNYFLKKQLIRVLIGSILMVVMFNIDYHDLQKLSWVLLLATWLLLIFVLIVGTKISGSRRTISLLGFPFQPSEAAKYALVIFLSLFLAKKGERIKNFFDGLLPSLIIIGIMILPIVLEPDLGTTLLIFSVTCVLLFVSGVNLYHLSALGIAALGGVAGLLATFSYQRHRLMMFLDTIRGVSEPPWQVLQSLICFANGGLWGVGLGSSRQKLHFLPQPFTDFIYSIITEETGFLGAALIIFLFLLFMWRGIWIALHAPDRQGRLLAIGITAAITLYAITSVAVAANIFPITGIPLPFISYGGSALIMNLMAVGILLNVSSQVTTKGSMNYAAPTSSTIRSELNYRGRIKSRRRKFAR